MPKRFNSTFATCILGILLCGAFIKSELAKFKITNRVSCPDSSLRYLAITDLSIGACANECKIRPICRSVSYQRFFHLCEIFSTADLKLREHPSSGRSPCMFIDRKDIEEGETPCNCTEGQACNDGAGCQIRECSPMKRDNWKIRGNQNHVGAEVEIECTHGLEGLKTSSKCTEHGNWTD